MGWGVIWFWVVVQEHILSPLLLGSYLQLLSDFIPYLRPERLSHFRFHIGYLDIFESPSFIDKHFLWDLPMEVRDILGWKSVLIWGLN